MKYLYLAFIAFLLPVAVFAVPGPISGAATVCTGQVITLSDATAGGVWTCSNTALATVGSTGVVTGVAAGTATISYTVSGSGTATATVTVTASPAAIAGANVFCNGANFDPMSDATAGGTWSCSPATVDYITSAGVLNHLGTCVGSCNTIDTVTYTISDGCSTEYLVNSMPINTAYFPYIICISTPTSANFTPSGGTWSSSNTAVATVNSAGLITGVSVGTATFTYTYLGCPVFGSASVSHGINDHSVINTADTFCSGPDFHIDACSVSTSYNVTTWFGDGTSNNTPFTSGSSSIDIFHTYTFPGTYYVKQVMYDGVAPWDSVAYSYEYYYCRTLPIKIYSDNNHDCMFDSGDTYSYLPSTIEVDSNGITVDTLSGTSGIYYQSYGPPGTVYSFRLLSTPGGELLSCPASGVLYDTISSYVNTYTPKYFGMNCITTSGFDLSVSTSMICGRHAVDCNIQIDNTYCTAVSPVVTMNFSPKYIFGSSYPAPATISGNTATWNIGSAFSYSPLPPLINVTLQIAGTWLTPGDTINSSFSVLPVAGDVNPANNYCVRTDTVTISYDPNEMAVSPEGYITSGTQLQYTINFENTGNDTAFNIYIMDTLSNSVDTRSLKIVTASAVMNTAQFTSGGYNIVKFDFPGINLLDSAHHNQCDGFVTFNINTNTALPAGTTIFNHAGIFFDDNPVVMTDTVEDIISIPSGITTLNNTPNISIYPNPANNILNITSTDDINNITISNLLGQVVFQEQPQQLPGAGAVSRQVDVSGWPSGMYFVKINGSGGSAGLTMTRRFVKL